MADDDYIPADHTESLRGASPSPMDRLSPKMQELARKIGKTRLDWENAYANLHDDASAGKKITGSDFTIADEKYSAEVKANTTELDQQITAEMVRQVLDTDGLEKAGESRLGRLVSNATSRVIKSSIGLDDIKQDVQMAAAQIVREQGAPGRLAAVRDTAPLDSAFVRDYVGHAQHQKNLALAPETHTPAELMADLLAKNPGIAIADIHVRNHSAKLVGENIETLKKSGVDTIYLEFPDEQFQKIDAMSAKEVRELAVKGYGGGMVLASAQGNADAYGVGHSDDTQKAWIEMIAAAKENHIRVVNIDKKGAARADEMALASQHRMASSNFIWTDHIVQDRERLASEGRHDGKYVVFGGYGHFVNTRYTAGMVDDALGLPVIAFDRRDSSAKPAIVHPVSLHSADFSLPGGTDYPATGKMAVADDLKSLHTALQHVSMLPGVPQLRGKLHEKTEQYDQVVRESLDIKGTPAVSGIPQRAEPAKDAPEKPLTLPVENHDPAEAPRLSQAPAHNRSHDRGK